MANVVTRWTRERKGEIRTCGFRNSNLEILSLKLIFEVKLQTWQRSEVRNPKSEIRNQNPEIRNL
jgi:hypothetical protein